MSGRKIIEGLDDVLRQTDPHGAGQGIDPSAAEPGLTAFGHTDYEPMLQWFEPESEHVDGPMLQWFARLAMWIAANVPRGAERTVCLRKLLEARDAAVRASLKG